MTSLSPPMNWKSLRKRTLLTSWKKKRRSYSKSGSFCWGKWTIWRGSWETMSQSCEDWTRRHQRQSSRSRKGWTDNDECHKSSIEWHNWEDKMQSQAQHKCSKLQFKSTVACQQTHSTATTRLHKRRHRCLRAQYTGTECTHWQERSSLGAIYR